MQLSSGANHVIRFDSVYMSYIKMVDNKGSGDSSLIKADMSHIMRKPDFSIYAIKAQISCTVPVTR